MTKKGQHGEPWSYDAWEITNFEGDYILDAHFSLLGNRAIDCVNVLNGWDIEEAKEALESAENLQNELEGLRAFVLHSRVAVDGDQTLSIGITVSKHALQRGREPEFMIDYELGRMKREILKLVAKAEGVEP